MSDPSMSSLARPAVGADWVLPALAVAFAAYFLVSVSDLVWEARATGTLVAAALLLLVGIQGVRSAVQLARGHARLAFGGLLGEPVVARERVLIVLLCALFIVAVPYLGTTPGLFLLTAALMRALRAGSWRATFATSGLIAAGAYLLFIALLDSRLPRGPFERLLGTLF
jgi:hypothetical protein